MVRSSLLDNLLWVGEPTLRVALLIALVRRNLARKFTAFTLYNFFWVVAVPFQFAIYHLEFYKTYYFVYWGCSAISGVLGLLVVTELLILKIGGVTSKFRRTLPILAVAVGGVVVIALDLQKPLTTVVQEANFEARIVEAALLAVFFTLSVSKSFPPRFDFYMAEGLALIVAAEMAEHFTISLATSFQSEMHYARVAIDLTATSLWLWGATRSTRKNEREITFGVRHGDEEPGFLTIPQDAKAGSNERGSAGSNFGHESTLPNKIMHYRIEAELAGGSSGSLYRAFDEIAQRPVALKVLSRRANDNPTRVKRFQREAALLRSLQHPNIPKFYGYQEIRSDKFIVMEYIEGTSLDSHIVVERTHGEIRELIGLFIQLGEALAHAHSKGVIHRDLKPANVMVTADGVIKVVDFGVAKGVIEELSPLTKTNEWVGTLAYCSPEQLTQKTIVDHRSDLFSFGSLMYTLVTGTHPFLRLAFAETMAAIINDEPRRPSQRNPNLPKGLEYVIRRALEKHPGGRFQSAHEIVFSLQMILASLSPERSDACA
jgi:predicted Ser/Thr protein kinase